MKHELTFKDNAVVPFDNGDGKIWFTTEALAELLGYADAKKVSNIYNRHKDEFTESMSTLAKVRKCNENNELFYTQNRLFSPRGAHLIGMISRTKVAKELRIWLLDLTDMAGQQIHDAITRFDKLSFECRGQRGSGLMAQRKRDIKKIREATRLALQLTQFSICDLGDFPDALQA